MELVGGLHFLRFPHKFIFHMLVMNVNIFSKIKLPQNFSKICLKLKFKSEGIKKDKKTLKK